MASDYRAYEVKVTVLVHKSQEPERDKGLVNDIVKEIRELVMGNVVIIRAQRD